MALNGLNVVLAVHVPGPEWRPAFGSLVVDASGVIKHYELKLSTGVLLSCTINSINVKKKCHQQNVAQDVAS